MPRSEVEFRRMKRADVAAVYEIECEAFSAPWPKSAFEEEAENTIAYYIVAEVRGDVVAYGGMWFAYDEAHIMNIAVRKAWRAQKIGTRLVAQMIAAAEQRGSAYMYLEVRQSNSPAIHTYRKLGFVQYGIREGYYTDNGEDALLMMKVF